MRHDFHIATQFRRAARLVWASSPGYTLFGICAVAMQAALSSADVVLLKKVVAAIIIDGAAPGNSTGRPGIVASGFPQSVRTSPLP